MDIAKISIIIPTLNEAENIKVTIASTQSSTNVEIIVVDGGSQDNTVEIARAAGVKIIFTINQIIVTAYLLGISPKIIKRMYR